MAGFFGRPSWYEPESSRFRPSRLRPGLRPRRQNTPPERLGRPGLARQRRGGPWNIPPTATALATSIRLSDAERRHLPHPPCGPLLTRHHQLKWAVLVRERLAV